MTKPTDDTFGSLSSSILGLATRMDFYPSVPSLFPERAYIVNIINDTDAPLWDVHVKGANFDMFVGEINYHHYEWVFPQFAASMPNNYEITGRYYGREFDLHTSITEENAKEASGGNKPLVNFDAIRLVAENGGNVGIYPYYPY